MSTDYFLNYLKTNFDTQGMDDEKIRLYVTNFKYAAKTPLLNPGDPCKYFYFIEKGMVRTYDISDTEEKTLNFYSSNSFLGSYKSFSKGEISLEGIICENEVTGIQISYEGWLELVRLYPKFLLISIQISDTIAVKNNQQFNTYCRTTAIERLKIIHETFPQITNIVLHKNIASFIGITPSYYSYLKSKNL